MVEAKVTSTVGVQMSPEGMAGAAHVVQKAIDGIIGKLETAGQKASAAIEKSGAASKNATAQINGELRALGLQLKNLKTLQDQMNSGAKGALGDFTGVQGLGRQARMLAEFRSGLTQTGTAMDALRGRVLATRDEMGRLLQKGVVPNNNDLLKARRIEDVAAAYGKLTNQITAMRGRVSLLSEQGQKAFAPMLKSLDELDKKNARVFSNQNLHSFGGELKTAQALALNLQERLVTREKIEAKTRLNIEALREEGRQILNNNTAQREALLAGNVRAGQSRLRNLSLIGGQLSQRDTDLTSRFARATTLAAVARNQLTAAMNAPNTSAERINTLIQRYQALQREIGLTIAQQSQINKAPEAKTGGFFGGIRHQSGNLFGDGDGGGAFGAGALVTRVAAYALAAGAIYGLISAIREGIQFAIQFEDALAQLQAISGATELQMTRLSDSILEVSKNSSSSVIELTKAATLIAQAGYAGAEIEVLLRNVTKLADASGATADEAVDVLTASLGAFQLEASEATRITDALVAALNASRLTVQQVQQGIQYVGATAKENNITFNELVATLGAMSDAGIRGTTASTGLRQMMVDLIDPSKKVVDELTKVGLTTADIDIKTLGLVEVLSRLESSGFQAYGALETRAAAAYTALSHNIEGITDLEEATLRQGAADEAQAQRLDSLSARWNIMINTLSETGAILGTIVTPAIKAVVSVMTVLIGIVNALIKPIAELVKWLGNLGEDFTSVTAEEFSERLERAGLTAAETADQIAMLGDSLEDVTTLAAEAEAQYQTLETRQKTLGEETLKLMVRKQDLAGSAAEVANQVNILASRFPGLRTEFAKTEGGISGLIQAMINLEQQAARTLLTQARVVRETARLQMDEANSTARDVQSRAGGANPMIMGVSQGQRAAIERDRANLNRMIQNRQYDLALDTYNTLPSNHYLRRDSRFQTQMRDVAQFRSEFVTGQQRYENAEQTIAAGNFTLNDPTGRGIVSNVRTNTALSQRASSQGSADGQSASAISGRISQEITRLERLSNSPEYRGNSAVLGVIGQALASQRAALAALAPEASDDGGGGRTPANRRPAQLARTEAEIQKEETEYLKELYENSLRALENAPDLEGLPELMGDLDQKLTDWLNAEAELALLSIEKNIPTAEQRARMLEAAGLKSEQLRLENIDKIADTLSKVIKEYIDSTTKAIENQFEQAMRFTQRNLALAQGGLTGLGNPLTSNNVPDYFRTVKQREVDTAQDRVNRASVGSNQRRIEQYQAMIDKITVERDWLNGELERLGRQEAGGSSTEAEIVVTRRQEQDAKDRLRAIGEELMALEESTYSLSLANDVLLETYRVLDDVPKTIKQGLQTAVQAVAIEVNAASSMGQEVINGLGEPLRAVHEGFKGFFADIMSGTVSAGQAFKNFAQTVIDAMLNMVAVALANQFFNLLAGMLGAPTGAPTNLLAGTPYVGGWKGGQIGGMSVRNMYGGGSVNRGLPTRDSTLLHASKEEYLIRRPAAMSLGKGFLDAINARGASALRGLGQPIMPIMSQGKQETNVYVVRPDQKPQLGPKDVLVIISDDMLQGGQTKQLVKRIANGG